MKPLLPTFLALTLALGGIICACDSMAGDMAGDTPMSAQHGDHAGHGGHTEHGHDMAHNMAHDMAHDMAATGCDHQNCENDCFTTSRVSVEHESVAKTLSSFELTFDDVDEAIITPRIEPAQRAGATGPPVWLLLAARTPITQHDRLLE